MTTATEKYVCPKCNTSLEIIDDKSLGCNKCNASWNIVDGVPNFIDGDNFWAEPGFTKERFVKINTDIQNKDWNEVIKNHESEEIRIHYKFLSDYGRIGWFDMLGLPDDATVLDLGAGMGTMSQALSKKCKSMSLYSVEPVKERIDFMRSRFRQEKCDNISIVRSDVDNLPFGNEKFDLIILNGVLEWLPVFNKDMNPRKVQIYYLKKLKKMLKKGGRIYIGIENRMAYSYYLGAKDPHILVKYVTILPRWISHIICKLTIGEMYRPYLYTHVGYKKLLKDSGFGSSEIYSALPSYNEPNVITHLSKHSREYEGLILPSKRTIAKLFRKVLVFTDTLKYFGYAYIIIGKK